MVHSRAPASLSPKRLLHIARYYDTLQVVQVIFIECCCKIQLRLTVRTFTFEVDFLLKLSTQYELNATASFSATNALGKKSTVPPFYQHFWWDYVRL